MSSHAKDVRKVTLNPDRKTLAISDDEGDIILWDVENGFYKGAIQAYSSSVRGVSFSSNGHIASGSDDGYIKVWNLTKGILVSYFPAHSRAISSLTFIYNNQIIISSSWDKKVKIWVDKAAISKFLQIAFFEKNIDNSQIETECVSTFPSFIIQQAQESKKSLVSATTSFVSTDVETVSLHPLKELPTDARSHDFGQSSLS